MSNELYFYGAVLLLIYAYFYLECWRHERNLEKVPLRIHVNGTRGKSSVTRLIAAGLRAGGHKVLAKTTGTAATVIFPSGDEAALMRRGPANIRENISIVRQAVQQGADTLVIECMAIDPQLQQFCQQRLIKAQLGVITNVRPDHEEIMGEGLENVAKALSNTVPAKGKTVTCRESLKYLQAAVPQADMYAVAGTELTKEELQGFSYEIIPDNLAIALQVCEMAGVNRQIALGGMRQAAADAGNLTIGIQALADKRIVCINALAANDPTSTLWLWENRRPAKLRTAVLLNCRSDRQYRSRQLCEMFSQVHTGTYMIAGDYKFAAAVLQRLGIPGENIVCLPANPDFQEVLSIIAAWPEAEAAIFAAGNMKGFSQKFLQQLGGG